MFPFIIDPFSEGIQTFLNELRPLKVYPSPLCLSVAPPPPPHPPPPKSLVILRLFDFSSFRVAYFRGQKSKWHKPATIHFRLISSIKEMRPNDWVETDFKECSTNQCGCNTRAIPPQHLLSFGEDEQGKTYKPGTAYTYNIVSTPCEDSDQTAHPWIDSDPKHLRRTA